MAKVLLACALFWPNGPRLYRAFAEAGFDVGAVAPARHPIHRLRIPGRTFAYRPWRSLHSLRNAIATFAPDLIVVCDDRMLAGVRALHSTAEPSIRALIETSLGSGAVESVACRRDALGDLHGLPGVSVPRIDAIGDARALRDWTRRHGLPAILKADGASGGQGIVVVRREAELGRAFLQARLRTGMLRNLKRLIVDGDAHALRFRQPAISAQSYVAGRAANIAVACWKGEVVAYIAVEVLRSNGPFGVATVVHLVEGEAMADAARSVCRRLHLSGLHGLDFVMDDESGTPRLIEINMRATQTCHLPLGSGRDLPAALLGAMTSSAAIPRPQRGGQGAIALFPGEWRRDPASPYLSSAFHDLPREDPELAQHYGVDCSRLSEAGYAAPALEPLR